MRFAFVLLIFSTSLALAVSVASAKGKRVEAQIARPPDVDEAQDRKDLKEIADYYMDDVLALNQNMQPTCFECQGSQANSPSQACRDVYADLYSKDTLDFRFLFGYMDQYNAEDGAARESAVERLMQPCATPAQGACGFSYESDDNDEVFVKTMRGPDGREKTVRLTIANSSVSTSLSKNRGPLAAVQTRQSQHVRGLFEDGLKNSDMTIYVGHGRDGGGPSFEPPRLRANGETDFAWYNQHPDSRQTMLRLLKGSAHPPKLMGVFACYSEKYFLDGIRGASPRTGVVGSTGFTAFEALYSQSLGMLDAVLAMRCERQFERSISSLREVSNNPTLPPARQLPPTIRGVWDRRLPSASQPPPPVPATPSSVPAEAEPVVTGETVRPERPPVLLPSKNQVGGDLSTPIKADGTKSQPRSTSPLDANH